MIYCEEIPVSVPNDKLSYIVTETVKKKKFPRRSDGTVNITYCSAWNIRNIYPLRCKCSMDDRCALKIKEKEDYERKNTSLTIIDG